MVAAMSKLRRRVVTIPAVCLVAVAFTLLLPLWLPICLLLDAVRLKFRFPLARLMLFGLSWSWLEIAGLIVAAVLWITGQSRNLGPSYRLQTWWADKLLTALRMTTGITITAEGVDALRPGPLVMLCRHASLADSLVSAWVVTSLAEMRPRYVLKRELVNDPCLDMFGNRLPNYFINREATDSAAELRQIARLSSGLGQGDIAIIFPEGTRSSAKKRATVREKLLKVDPRRAERLAAMEHLLPPRPAGTIALLNGSPSADVVVAWHVGFDGLNDFGGILKALSRTPMPVVFRMRRISRSEVPDGDAEAMTEWLDATWLRADRDVAALLDEVGR
jgi:1-acyl-sn-glycerol-3-phosphate acyltransferase